MTDLTGGAEHLADGVALISGDCVAALPELDADSFDACVTDPPYHLQSITKRFAKKGRTDKTRTTSGPHQRTARGFMNTMWDGGDVAFQVETWREVFRVLKPGAHLLAFGGTRTYHRMACAIEDAGFEIRDSIQWLYGSGFPKSLDVSKAIDKAAGVNGSFGEHKSERHAQPRHYADGMERPCHSEEGAVDRNGREYIAATDSAREWDGFGTALKPACELIVLARKPLSESTVAANVLKWGTGALNIDGGRVAHDEQCKPKAPQATVNSIIKQSGRYEATTELKPLGRWPANVIHDGSDEVVEAFPDVASGSRQAGEYQPQGFYANAIASRPDGMERDMPALPGSSGSAARFFYTAKADSDDRLGSKHPTVKPLDLMQYLARLVTPPGGLILDPFAGTGTTGEAAFREGFRAVLIEREVPYQVDIRRRMRLALTSERERSHESIKAGGKDKPPGPLFAIREVTK